MFDIDDKIIVVNNGQIYSSYNDWFTENSIPTTISKKFTRNRIDVGNLGTIVATGPHANSGDTLYAIENENNKVFIIGEKGIALAPDYVKKPFIITPISFEDLLKGEK